MYRCDTYVNRAKDLMEQISKWEYVLMNNPSVISKKKNVYTSKNKDIIQKDQVCKPNKNTSIFYKPETDLSLANLPLSDMIDHVTPLKKNISERRHDYTDGYGNLKKGIKINDALKNIWRDVVNFSFTTSNDITKDTVTNRLVNIWKDILKEVVDCSSFSNITEKRQSSVLVLLQVIEKIIDANMQHSHHFIKDAVLCRLIRGAIHCLYKKFNTVPLSTEMQYIPFCNEITASKTLEKVPSPGSISDDYLMEARVKGVYGYGDFYPQCEKDHTIALRDICSDYFLKLLFEFLLSPHIHSTWRESYFIPFTSSVLKLIRNHEPFILALSKRRRQDPEHQTLDEQMVDEQLTDLLCEKYFNNNATFMLEYSGCHPFIFLPTATDFWSFCKNGQPIYDIKNIIVNARPSSFPPVCGGPAGISQGKQLAWERFCQRQGICDHSCNCDTCTKRKKLVDRVRQRFGYITGEMQLTDVTKWHQGSILMINFYAFTGLLAHHDYASYTDDKVDFFKNLILAIEKSHYMKNNQRLFTGGGGESDTSNSLHVITFGIDTEFRYKLKSPQKKPIFITASLDNDILEGDNISKIQLVALRERKASELNCWF
uniref:Wsv427-like protein n=1 Tax=Melicertus latisulcatus majanivirus TaxID=2984277 RepID=A0A9C7F6Q8_9VIRU|nr:MAG: wsv427-like protein [Melicertus latisulcatus majanivirus]